MRNLWARLQYVTVVTKTVHSCVKVNPLLCSPQILKVKFSYDG